MSLSPLSSGPRSGVSFFGDVGPFVAARLCLVSLVILLQTSFLVSSLGTEVSIFPPSRGCQEEEPCLFCVPAASILVCLGETENGRELFWVCISLWWIPGVAMPSF